MGVSQAHGVRSCSGQIHPYDREGNRCTHALLMSNSGQGRFRTALCESALTGGTLVSHTGCRYQRLRRRVFTAEKHDLDTGRVRG